MPRPPRTHDDEDYLDEREFPDEADQDDDDGPETMPCPYCRAEISEDAAICPRCRSFISAEDVSGRKPWWIIAAAIALLAAILIVWVL